MSQIFLENEQATEFLGAKLQQVCAKGIVFYLIGDLGVGKTTLVRGFLRSAGWSLGVKSPTYTLVETYCISGKEYYHFDLYRLTDPEELSFIGIRDYIQKEAVCLIEWPERARAFLPAPDLIVYLEHAGLTRTAKIEAVTSLGEHCLEIW